MSKTCELIIPTDEYCNSYYRYIGELEETGESRVPFVLDYDSTDFSVLLARLKNDSQGIDLQDWQVPCSTFWLVEANSEIVGVSNLRHRLNDNLKRLGGHIGFGIRPSARRKGYGTIILRETLVKAREINIDQVLVTCDKSNIGSAAAIKKNGGVFQDEEFIESENDIVQRYIISL